jgi:hypothetical protein
MKRYHAHPRRPLRVDMDDLLRQILKFSGEVARYKEVDRETTEG